MNCLHFKNLELEECLKKLKSLVNKNCDGCKKVGSGIICLEVR